MENKYKIFQVNMWDWWVATSLEEAIETASREMDIPVSELTDEWTHELTDKELDRKMIINEDGTERMTFRSRLIIETAKGIEAPYMFASTEY